jgi:hypothetical protein
MCAAVPFATYAARLTHFSFSSIVTFLTILFTQDALP